MSLKYDPNIDPKWLAKLLCIKSNIDLPNLQVKYILKND